MKMADFKVYLLCQCAHNQKVNGELCYIRTIYLNLSGHIFDIRVSFGIMCPSNIGCYNIRNNVSSHEE